MKISTFLFLSLPTLFFWACQKEFSTETGTPAVTSFNKIKTYTEDLTVGGNRTVVTFNINYDGNDRIISMISASTPGDKFLFQYNSITSYTMDIYESNALVIHADFFLNSIYLIDSTFQYNDSNDTLTEKYLYNSGKQLIRLREYDYSTATGGVLTNTHNYLYDSKGDQIRETDNYSITTLEYTNILNDIVVFPHYSVKPVHLIETTTITDNGGTNTINHTYTFDSKKRLSTERQEVANGSEVLVKSYTYY